MKTPTERYAIDVQGMPVFAAAEPLTLVLSPASMADGVPKDDENCPVALGCKQQLAAPYVSVGRHRTDIAMPHPKGVKKLGYGDTLWAVIRYENPRHGARRVVIECDLDELDRSQAVVVELKSPRPSARPDGKRKMRKRPVRKPQGKVPQRGRRGGPDRLTQLGVRNLAGQRRRR